MDENYDYGEVSIHIGKHKHHLHNESSTTIDIII